MREPVLEYLDTGVALPLSLVPVRDLIDIVAGRVSWTPEAFETDRSVSVAIAAHYLREKTDNTFLSEPGALR
jgi:hypothetical protein